MDNTRRPVDYGIDVPRVLGLFGVPATELPRLLASMDLPAPKGAAIVAWGLRNSIPSQWLGVLLIALARRGVNVDLSEFVIQPGALACA